jgi:hypothetical protein
MLKAINEVDVAGPVEILMFQNGAKHVASLRLMPSHVIWIGMAYAMRAMSLESTSTPNKGE